MQRLVVAGVVVAVAVTGAVVASSSQDRDPLPAGHPPLVPPGHPPVTTAPRGLPPGHPAMPAAAPPARAEDVATAQSVIAAYYASISGPAGAARDWGRFETLFAPDARLVTVVAGPGGDAALALTPGQFAGLNGRYFEASGYSERPILDHVDRFGRIAHVRSTYESRRGDDAPYARGINSFQLVETAGRWGIVCVLWERERADLPLGPEHLPADPAAHRPG